MENVNLTELITSGIVNGEVFVGDLDTLNQEEAIKILKELGYVSKHATEHTWIPISLDNEVEKDGAGLAITSYVVGTSLDEQAWKVFLFHTKVLNLQPIVVPVRYKNPSSLAEALSQDDQDCYIDPRVYPYLKSKRFEYEGVTVFCDIKAQITAVDPLNNISSLSRGRSCVLPHPTQSIISVPRTQDEPPVLMTTTGFISVNAMGDHLAAKKAEFHCVKGWVIISADPSEPLVRLVHAYHGAAYDLGFKVTPDDISYYAPVSSFWGDIHFGHEDKQALTWAKKITEEHECRSIVLNDTFDGSTINHHEKNIGKYRRFRAVHEEVEYHNREIKILESSFKVSIMQSNHNEWFQRWVSDVHPHHDLHEKQDVEIYADCLSGNKILQGDIQKSGSLVGKHRLFHGHESCNGGRLTHRSLAKTGYKSAYAHTHSPLQYQGVVNPGCLCLIVQDYTEGSLTSWAHGVVMLYDNGVVQLLIKR